MAIRTTAAAVALIIKVNATATPDLGPFIEAANSIVTAVCTSTALTEAQLELIERWLSAHMYAIRAPRRAMERAGDVAQSFQYKVDLGLKVTTYGQQAMLLDTSGALANLDARTTKGGPVRATVAWLGTDDP